MNILKRLKNLWNISEYKVPAIGTKYKAGDLIVPELYKPKEVVKPKIEIIKKETATERFLKENKE